MNLKTVIMNAYINYYCIDGKLMDDVWLFLSILIIDGRVILIDE